MSKPCPSCAAREQILSRALARYDLALHWLCTIARGDPSRSAVRAARATLRRVLETT